IAVANPDIADVVVIRAGEMVITAKTAGETDAIVWQENGSRQHYRIQVRSPSQRQQIVVGIKFAEVRREVLHELGVSGLYRDDDVRVGTGIFRSDNAFDNNGNVVIPGAGQFLSVLTDFNTDKLLGFLEAQEQRGNARTLAEPSIMAGNRDSASFLAGGELPIPVAQGGLGDEGTRISIQYKEFGVRLSFMGEIINDSLIKVTLSPEVSSLDFGNAITISGFRIPAFRTRRIHTTVDVKRNQSLIISGMFNEERERVRTGVPGLMDLPIIGALFGSTRWQKNESELLVIVSPDLFDPARPRARDVVPIVEPPGRPANEAIEKRLPPSQRQPARRP
ncbi:MAG TPA: pilus assembly protein N-terminal domain-containing protein, partial [Gemmatimonadaceae bacterium]